MVDDCNPPVYSRHWRRNSHCCGKGKKKRRQKQFVEEQHVKAMNEGRTWESYTFSIIFALYVL